MSRITREEVERVALLARLDLSPDEAARMERDLESILGYVAALSELDTEGVEPTSHALPLATPLRPDRAAAPLDPERALRNAPARAGTAFLVPRVTLSEDEG